MTEQQKKFILDNKNVTSEVLACFLGVSYHVVYGFRYYLQLTATTNYNGCGIPSDRRIR